MGGGPGGECLEGRKKQDPAGELRHEACAAVVPAVPQTVLEPRGPAELFCLGRPARALPRTKRWPGEAVTLAPGWGGGCDAGPGSLCLG